MDRLVHASYEHFVTNYMLQNKPCIFDSNITDSWRSRSEWVKVDGSPDLEYLVHQFGSATVPVVSCDLENTSCERQEMLFESYIDKHLKTETKNTNDEHFYLKDWHFNRAFPTYKAYEIPKYFKEDWLNEFSKNETDDFQFVYIGPKGSWTPLHADVYGSFSWSANICGRKRWILFPPGQEKLLKQNGKNLPFMLKIEELAFGIDAQYLDIVQAPGEIIFVPSGWYHQVWNLDATISINHNWFNKYNILYIWKCLESASLDVEQELADLKQFDDWWDNHEFLLKAHHGMNLYEFLKILRFIFESRMIASSITENLSQQQRKNDLLAVKNTCDEMLKSHLPIDVSKNINTLKEEIMSSLMHFSKTNIL